MNRVIRGPVVLAAALVAISCKGDPTDSLRNGVAELTATPGALFLRPDSTKLTIVGAVDEQGNQILVKWAIGAVSPGITVTVDPNFGLIYNNQGVLVKPDKATREQFIVTATGASGDFSFVVSGSGKNLMVPVRIIPDSAASFTLSSAAPALGDTVVATAGANFKFTPASVVTITGAGVKTVGINADSSQIRFLPGPSANNTVQVSNTIVAYAPTLPAFTSKSDVPLVTPVVANFPATFSNGTPAIQDTVTITAGAGFKFLPTATVSTGQNAVIVTRAPDSSAIRFVPIPGTTTGPVAVTGVVLDFLTSVSLTLPSSASLTPPAALAGASAVATAPTITIPGVGQQSLFVDNGAFATAAECGNVGAHCRFYKLVLGAPTTFTTSLRWGNTADIGGYFIDAAGNDQFGDFACDAKGSGAGGQPEACTETLPAGTWYLALADFTGAAQNTNVQITLSQ